MTARLGNSHSRRTRLLRALLALVAVAAAVVSLPATAAPVPEGYTYSHAWFTSVDGTQLHAGVFLPADRKATERHPVLLVSTPYASPNGGAGSPGNLDGAPPVRFPELFEHSGWAKGRWAYVEVDVRGFGGSGGCFSYYLPDEAADVKVAVEWAAKAPWSTGRIGMWGKSYDAAQQVLALASKPRGLAASVIQAPGLSAYTALWMNGVHYAGGRYATTGVYTVDDVGPAQNTATATSPQYAAATASGLTANPTCRSDGLARMNTERDRASSFWKGKEPYLKAAGSTVPVLWSHGFADANTKPQHLPIWTSLRGPKQAWFGQYTHVRGQEAAVGREGFLDESVRFLDRHVRGTRTKTDAAVTVQEGNGEGRWRHEAAWPPADALRWSMPIRKGSYVDEPGNNADGASAGQGHLTVSRPLPYDAHLAGEVAIAAKVSTVAPYANVVAHLYDIDENGEATFVARGAFASAKTGAQTVSYTLYPQDWRFLAGHRIGIHLSGSDDEWFTPGVSHTSVTVGGGSVTLPLLRFARTRFVAGDISDGMNGTPWTVDEARLEESTVVSPPPPRQRRR